MLANKLIPKLRSSIKYFETKCPFFHFIICIIEIENKLSVPMKNKYIKQNNQ